MATTIVQYLAFIEQERNGVEDVKRPTRLFPLESRVKLLDQRLVRARVGGELCYSILEPVIWIRGFLGAEVDKGS